jgi:hypothetical protein
VRYNFARRLRAGYDTPTLRPPLAAVCSSSPSGTTGPEGRGESALEIWPYLFFLGFPFFGGFGRPPRFLICPPGIVTSPFFGIWNGVHSLFVQSTNVMALNKSSAQNCQLGPSSKGIFPLPPADS